MNVLITGATGNVGIEVIKQLIDLKNSINIVAGVRNIEKSKNKFPLLEGVNLVKFDFEDRSTFDSALNNIDVIFLLRPPHISDIKTYFEPLIEAISQKGINKVVFLSVQGAEKNTVIPHRKIELLLLKYKIDYIFMRPSYFMQNLTTTLIKEIHENRSITLPSGRGKFNWVDIENIAELGAKFITEFDNYKNNAFTISGNENLNFGTVVNRINSICNTDIKYRSVNPFKYYRIKKSEGIEKGMIIVMLILHWLPRIQKEVEIISTYSDIFNKEPNSIDYFIERNKEKFI